MVVLQSCLCCSLFTGSIFAGILSTFMYSLAFFIQLWWIVEAKVPLSIPAYILATGYLLMASLSTALLMALRTHRPQVLLSWVFLMILYIFPEAGLVLFMSLYQWGNRTYGVVEISLWLVRVLSNLTGIVCVQSLWTEWREEKSLFRSLHELGITSSGVADHSLGIPGKVKLRGSLRKNMMTREGRTLPGLGDIYSSLPRQSYTSSLGDHDTGSLGTLSVTKFPSKPSKYMKRSASSASQYVSASRSLPPSQVTTPMAELLTQRYKQPHGVSNNEFSPEVYKASLSQPDLSMEQGVYVQRGYGAGSSHWNIYRGNSRRDQLLSTASTLDRYRPRHLGRTESVTTSLSERYSVGASTRPGEERTVMTGERWGEERLHPHTVYEVLDSTLERRSAGEVLYRGVGGEVRARGGVLGPHPVLGPHTALGPRQHSVGELSRDSRDQYGDIAL